MSSERLGILWQPSGVTGWGLYGLHLLLNLELKGRIEPCLLIGSSRLAVPPLASLRFRAIEERSQGWIAQMKALEAGGRLDLPMTVLHGLGEELTPPYPDREIRGRRNIGVIFFVDPALGPEARERGKALDAVVAGSTWNAVLLESAGIPNVRLVIQGIDTSIFHVAPRQNLFPGRFVIFSGGKLEFRKGQDIAIAAFKIFRARHPEALLLANWYNAWPKITGTMALSPHEPSAPQLVEGRPDIAGWLHAQGLPGDSAVLLDDLPNMMMGSVLREADAALFPNRCEPGTNLVAMEAMACGVPTILSANTGHLDVIDESCLYPLREQRRVRDVPFHRSTEGWGESSVDEAVEALERIYANRSEAAARALKAASWMRSFSWPHQIDCLIESLNPSSVAG
jgi:glycosyltransferase involved in cell wall biosynthesis